MTTKLKKQPVKKVAVKRVTKKTTITETPVKRGPGRPRKVVTEVVKKPEVINIIPNIIQTNNNGIATIRFSIPGDKSGTSNYVYTSNNPTGSCQLFSVAYFQNIRWLEQQAQYLNKGKKIKIDYKPLIVAIRKSVYTKNLMFIDVRSSLSSFVKELFPKQIISETPYNSTNGSHMVLYTINVREFI